MEVKYYGAEISHIAEALTLRLYSQAVAYLAVASLGFTPYSFGIPKIMNLLERALDMGEVDPVVAVVSLFERTEEEVDAHKSLVQFVEEMKHYVPVEIKAGEGI